MLNKFHLPVKYYCLFNFWDGEAIASGMIKLDSGHKNWKGKQTMIDGTIRKGSPAGIWHCENIMKTGDTKCDLSSAYIHSNKKFLNEHGYSWLTEFFFLFLIDGTRLYFQCNPMKVEFPGSLNFFFFRVYSVLQFGMLFRRVEVIKI